MEISSRDLINAAVAQALAQISTSDLARILADSLNDPHDARAYGSNKETRLEHMVAVVMDQVARDVVTKVVQSHRDDIETMIINQLAGHVFSVTVGGYNSDLKVSVTLGKPGEEQG